MTKNTKAANDNRSNQMNPNSPAYSSSRSGGSDSKAGQDNRANQMNPNSSAYKKSR